MNSRSASWAPAARARMRPEPNEPGGFVVRDQSAAAPPVASSVALAWIGSPPLRRTTPPPSSSPADPFALEDLDQRMLGRGRRQRAQDPAAGRAPAGVDDAAAAVPALEAEREVAVAVGVELAAQVDQLADAGGRLVGEGDRGGALREAPAGLERVLEVNGGGVVDGERRGRAALGPVGGGLGERAGAHEGHARTFARGCQGREETGRAGADDDEVGSHAGRGYYGVGDGGDSTARDLAARRRFHGSQRARASGAPGADSCVWKRR